MEAVAGSVLEQRGGHLGAAGVLDADEQHLRHRLLDGAFCGGECGEPVSGEPFGLRAPGSSEPERSRPGGVVHLGPDLDVDRFRQVLPLLAADPAAVRAFSLDPEMALLGEFADMLDQSKEQAKSSMAELR